MPRVYARLKHWVTGPSGNDSIFTHIIPDLVRNYSAKTAEELVPEIRVRIAGRMQTIRRMGKAGFAAHAAERRAAADLCQERRGSRARLSRFSDCWISATSSGVEGYLFRTRTGELSVHVEKLEFLSKTLLAMPEKWHGLEDVETRYRQRYLDLIANPEVAQGFRDAREDHLVAAPATRGARISSKWRRR